MSKTFKLLNFFKKLAYKFYEQYQGLICDKDRKLKKKMLKSLLIKFP